jgi:hypothetical protein
MKKLCLLNLLTLRKNELRPVQEPGWFSHKSPLFAQVNTPLNNIYQSERLCNYL